MDPQPVDALVDKIEGVLQRRRAGTEMLRVAWENGTLTKQQLPCFDRCDGNIVAPVEGQRVRGFCPMHMEPSVCPLPTLAEREMLVRLQRSGFGKQYHNPDPNRIRAMQGVNEYLGHVRSNITKGRGMILAGDVGVGKTMTLAYLARQLLDENIGVWKVHMPELVNDLADRDRRRGVVERAIKVEMLMLDDFGSGDMPTWVLGILEGIVEHRYGHKKPMILTTNLERGVLVRAPEFRRMVDRWRETCTFISISGSSQRHDVEPQ